MRVSCNGCRVLRKGCSENCPIRTSLQWIKTPQSQANATVFLAKFYGRAALQNLINAGPHDLRPEIFRSLLYEACGRIVNPIYGSAGLLWSGNWQLCHAAVEAVLNGAPISPETAASDMSPPPLKACDIRHVCKEDPSDSARDLNKVKNGRRFKRAGKKPKGGVGVGVEPAVDEAARVMLSWSNKEEASRRSRGEESGGDGDGDSDSVSVETVEAALTKADGSDVELELTLGLEPALVKAEKVEALKSWEEIDGSDDATCGVQLGL